MRKNSFACSDRFPIYGESGMNPIQGERKMKQITEAVALKILKSIGSSCVSFQMETEQSSLNKGRGASAMVEVLGVDPDEIVKHTSLVALVGTNVNYQTLVENRLVKESALNEVEAPSFTAENRKWGERVDGVEVQHKGESYITLHCVMNNVPQVKHTYKGKEIDLKDNKFNPYRKPEKVEGARQGLDKPIIYRDYALSSVKAFTTGGETYFITR